MCENLGCNNIHKAEMNEKLENLPINTESDNKKWLDMPRVKIYPLVHKNTKEKPCYLWAHKEIPLLACEPTIWKKNPRKRKSKGNPKNPIKGLNYNWTKEFWGFKCYLGVRVATQLHDAENIAGNNIIQEGKPWKPWKEVDPNSKTKNNME